jgi:hypothetical protein
MRALKARSSGIVSGGKGLLSNPPHAAHGMRGDRQKYQHVTEACYALGLSLPPILLVQADEMIQQATLRCTKTGLIPTTYDF